MVAVLPDAPSGTGVRGPLPHRVAVLSVHTSPLDPPGSGDAGGLNVYVRETARRMARLGVEVEVFTRATSSALPPVVEVAPGVLVRHVDAGPYEGLAKDELPAQLCAFTAGVLHAEAARTPGWFDVVHSHYWLSGQVGFLAAERWGVPLVHTAHTLAAVKNAALAAGDAPEPRSRLVGEQQVVAAADRLVVNTAAERTALLRHYAARADKVVVVPPGVDLEVFRPGDATVARSAVGVPPDAELVLQVGRVQPLKGPDVLLRATAELLARDPARRERLLVVVCGGQSGGATSYPARLAALAAELGVDDVVRFEPPAGPERLAAWYRAADVVAVPSHSESFGLVAVEAQACGTPVVAARVGGLPTAVADGTSGLLVGGHEPGPWADALDAVLSRPGLRARLARGARSHASAFSWERTTTSLLCTYRDAMREAGVVHVPRADDARLAAVLPC